MALSHIEVPIERRGDGIGAVFALEVFLLVRDLEVTGRITCSFMRRIAAGVPEWAEFFNFSPVPTSTVRV